MSAAYSEADRILLHQAAVRARKGEMEVSGELAERIGALLQVIARTRTTPVEVRRRAVAVAEQVVVREER